MLPGSIAGGIREKKRPAGTRLAHIGPTHDVSMCDTTCGPHTVPSAAVQAAQIALLMRYTLTVHSTSKSKAVYDK